jgi:hypothetical protein
MKSKKHRAGKKPKYNMRGCSRKMRKYLGGQSPQNTPVPSTGPPPNPYTALSSKFQFGGSGCGCGQSGGRNSQNGGGCGCGKLFGGQNGGSTTFVGSPWSANNWPSANNANHYPMNTYTPVDIQLQTKVLGANPPFSKGGRRMRKSRIRSKSRTRRSYQKGGNLSNFLLQDLVNFGRGLSYSAGSAYNTILGAQAPVSPLPWQGQLQGTTGTRII